MNLSVSEPMFCFCTKAKASFLHAHMVQHWSQHEYASSSTHALLSASWSWTTASFSSTAEKWDGIMGCWYPPKTRGWHLHPRTWPLVGWGRSPTVCPPMPQQQHCPAAGCTAVLAVLACQYIAAQAGVRKEKKKKSLGWGFDAYNMLYHMAINATCMC